MATLTASQIAAYARGAGIKDPKAVRVAVAIALAESGGNPQAHNPNPPDDSYGLWQINMLGSMGPARRRQWGLKSNAELYNPAVNAKAMFDLSNGGKNWTPWTTFTRGSYLAHLSEAAKGVANAGSVPVETTTVGSSEPSAFAWLVDPDTYRRGAKVLVGFVLVLGALGMLVWPTLRPAAKRVAKVMVTRKVKL